MERTVTAIIPSPFARTISNVPDGARWGPKTDGAYLCHKGVVIPICTVGIVSDVGVWNGADTVPRAESEVELLRGVDYDAMATLLNLAKPQPSPSTLSTHGDSLLLTTG